MNEKQQEQSNEQEKKYTLKELHETITHDYKRKEAKLQAEIERSDRITRKYQTELARIRAELNKKLEAIQTLSDYYEPNIEIGRDDHPQLSAGGGKTMNPGDKVSTTGRELGTPASTLPVTATRADLAQAIEEAYETDLEEETLEEETSDEEPIQLNPEDVQRELNSPTGNLEPPKPIEAHTTELDKTVLLTAVQYGAVFTVRTLQRVITKHYPHLKNTERGRIKLSIHKLVKLNYLTQFAQKTEEGTRWWYQPAESRIPIHEAAQAKYQEMLRTNDPDLQIYDATKSPESLATELSAAVKRPNTQKTNLKTNKVRRT